MNFGVTGLLLEPLLNGLRQILSAFEYWGACLQRRKRREYLRSLKLILCRLISISAYQTTFSPHAILLCRVWWGNLRLRGPIAPIREQVGKTKDFGALNRAAPLLEPVNIPFPFFRLRFCFSGQPPWKFTQHLPSLPCSTVSGRRSKHLTTP
jgi:hypothetical protein